MIFIYNFVGRKQLFTPFPYDADKPCSRLPDLLMDRKSSDFSLELSSSHYSEEPFRLVRIPISPEEIYIYLRWDR